jgi:4-amino-4-deoxy-L-arabinose transferase-like glycosyltransferase
MRPLCTTRVALGAIVLVGLALRLGTVGFGHDWLTFQPDEDANIPIALRLSWGHLNPHVFYYPDLTWYLLFTVNWLVYWFGKQLGLVADWTQFRSLFESQPVPFFLLGRTLSVAVGTATIGLVYALGRRLYSPAHGLVAAAFLAVAFLHVRDSALATPDATMTGLVVLSLLGAAGVLRYGRPRDYALAAVAAGLATAAKYNAILVVGACIAAHGLRQIQTGGSVRRGLLAPRLPLVVGAACLVFLVLDPYLLLDWPDARAGLAWQWTYSHTGQYLDVGPAWRYHLTVSLRYGLGLGLLALALVGVAWALWRRDAGGILLASFAVPFFLEMSSLHAVFVRYMTPLVPVLCLFAASALVGLARRSWTRGTAWLPITLGVLVLIEPCTARWAMTASSITRTLVCRSISSSRPSPADRPRRPTARA